MAGDLIEKFRERRSQVWFWKQVLIAIAVSFVGQVQRHWPHICYAIAGTAMMVFPLLVEVANRRPAMVRWWGLSWPWSMLVADSALQSLAPLPVLAVALLMRGAFRWVSLLRTAIISATLLALPPFLLDQIIGPHIMPPAIFLLVFFSTFFVSAWLGCVSPQRVTPTAEPVDTA